MSGLCQIADGITNLRYYVFSLTGLLGFITLASAYIYLGPVKMIIHSTIAMINSFFGLVGAGTIGILLLVSRFLC